MRPHEWFTEHAAAYAIRALDPEDERAFVAHLAECDACRREVAAIERDLRWLPMGAEPKAPRPGFQQRILDRVTERPRPRRPSWTAPAAMAASLLLAAGAWYLGSSRSRALQRELESQRVAVAALQDTLSVIRTAGRILQANLEVGPARGGLVIFADEVTHRWNVVIHGLPPAPSGYQYQFWFICADSMVRGNEITGSTTKPTMFTTGMPQPTSCTEVKGAALTEEPTTDGQGPPRGKALAHLML